MVSPVQIEDKGHLLQTEFPDVRGFSSRNIWRMKTFYEYYNTFLQIAENQVNKNSATVVALNSNDSIAEIQIAENSATAVALFSVYTETQGNENSAATVALFSGTSAEELQNFIFQLITNVGWTQKCIILEKCKILISTENDLFKIYNSTLCLNTNVSCSSSAVNR